MFIRETTEEKVVQGENKICYLSPNVIKYLIIDDCHMSDENLAKILDEAIEQREIVEFRYTNNEIGPKSLERLKLILDNEANGIFLRSL